jgi:hypothetical protein
LVDARAGRERLRSPSAVALAVLERGDGAVTDHDPGSGQHGERERGLGDEKVAR